MRGHMEECRKWMHREGTRRGIRRKNKRKYTEGVKGGSLRRWHMDRCKKGVCREGTRKSRGRGLRRECKMKYKEGA